MTATSNPTRRVVKLLDFLIAHPTEGFGLSELARQINVSKATCLAVASTLVEAGYLLQHPQRKTYTVGPALIAAGQAGLSRFPDVNLALEPLRALAVDESLACTVVSPADDQMVVVARVGPADPLRGLSNVGMRVPLVPPYGAVLVGWSDNGTLDAWLRRPPNPLRPDEVDSLRQSIHLARQRGYVVSRELPEDHPRRAELEALRGSSGPPNWAELTELTAVRRRTGYFIDEIDPDQSYRVNHLDVPVLSRSGWPVLGLEAILFGSQLTGRQLDRLGRKLMKVATDISRLLGGSSVG